MPEMNEMLEITDHKIVMLARECQQEDFSSGTGHWFKMEVKDLRRFAELIAQHEREECAKVCDILQDQYLALDDRYGTENSELYYGKSCGAADCAEAIRVKG